MTIRFNCECGQNLAVRDEYAGKRVRCNACNATQTVPEAAPGAEEEEAQAPGILRFTCEDCGKSVQAKSEHAGKKTKCPGCGAILTIPAAAGATKAAAVQAGKPRSVPARVQHDDEDEDEDRQEDEEQDEDERPRRGGKKKKKGGKSKKGLWIGVAVCVLLLVGTGFGAWMLFFRGGSASSDFDLVPRDALGFATLRNGDLLRSDIGKKAMNILRGQAGKQLKEVEDQMGMSFEDIEWTTYVVMDENTFWGIARTSKPLDRQKFIAGAAQNGFLEKEYMGKKYHASADIGTYFADDKTIVTGSPRGIERVIGLPKSPKKGPLDDLIVQASKSKPHLFVGGNVPSILALAEGKMGPGGPMGGMGSIRGIAAMVGAGSLLDAQLAHFTCHFGNKGDLQLGLDYATAEKAKSAEAELKKLVATAESLVKLGGLARLGKDLPIDAGQATKTVSNLLGQISPKQDGNRLSVGIAIDKADIEKVLDSAAQAGGGPGPGGGGAIDRVREASNRAASQNNFKMILIGFHNAASTANDRFPAHAIYDPQGKPLLSWRVALLPFVEEGILYKQIRLNEPWDSAYNRQFWNRMPKVYELAGHNAGPGMTYIQNFAGPGTLFNGPAKASIGTIADGSSNTILIAEANAPVNWMAPDTKLNAANPRASLGNHYGRGALVALADGSVRIVSSNVSDTTLKNAINPSDGKPLGPDWDN